MFKAMLFKRTVRLLRPLEALRPRIYMAIYVRLAALGGVVLHGTPRYVSSSVKYDDPAKLVLGERVVISADVLLLTHDYSVTTALRYLGVEFDTDVVKRAGIEIGDNVFVGIRAILMPGARIGNDVIIGAGSVVRGVVPSGSIVVGNPGAVVEKISDRSDRWLEMVESDATFRDRR